MKTTFIILSVLISFSAFSQSSVLIAPNGNNGIFSKNNATVTTNPGTVQPSVSGGGTRLMWMPAKSAFRVGTVDGTHWDADSIGTWSTAFGHSTVARGDNSTAWGYLTAARGNYSTAWGVFTTASGEYSTAWGQAATARGDYSTARGFATTADGGNSSAWGYITKANASISTAWGHTTTANGYASTAWGEANTAGGYASTVWGYGNIAGGTSSTSWGYQSAASGNNSTSWGYQSAASGDYSTAWGFQSAASGNYSTAWGFFTNAGGNYSTVWGTENTASGDYSTAWGRANTASGAESTAIGEFTTSQSYGSLVMGRYNVISGTAGSWVATDPLFVIGNGSASNTRNNAVTVLKNGRVGIGTATPDAALHITGTATSTPSTTRAYFNVGSGTAIVNNTNVITGTIKVHADGNFWADGGGFIATSDARIKRIIGQSNSAEDLDKLTQIAVTDYIYIDEVNHGNIPQKKVIAQQLKTILPAAVSQNKGFIPYLYQNAQQVSPVGNTTHIRTEKAHGLVNGDVVKVIVEHQGEKHLTVSVLDAHTFSVEEPLQGQVFVYGKQVDDLHHVDYDAISMLNVSATQELAKQIQLLKQKNQQLEDKNQQLEAKIGEIEVLKSQMATLNALLLKTDNQPKHIQVAENKE